MEKFKDFVDKKEKNKPKKIVKTPFKDFVTEREDVSFSFTNEDTKLFFAKEGFIHYKSEKNDYVQLFEIDDLKEGFVFVKALENKIEWKYTDEKIWRLSDYIDSNTTMVEDGFIEYRSGDDWCKITILDEYYIEAGRSGKDGADGTDGIGIAGQDGRDGTDGKDGVDGKSIQGRKGDKGDPGKTIKGKDGTDGKDGSDGRAIELKSKDKKIYRRYIGDKEWILLLDLNKKSDKEKLKDITDKAKPDEANEVGFGKTDYGLEQYPMLPGISIGAPGPAGAGTEMQIDGNILQWRPIGTTVWIDLIDLSTIVPETPPGEGITISDDGVELGTGISSLNFLTDGAIEVAGGVATITLGEEMKYTSIVDFDGDYIYKGEADPGSAEGAAVWRVSRVYINPVTDDIDTRWAGGTFAFDKIWTGHLSFTYS